MYLIDRKARGAGLWALALLIALFAGLAAVPAPARAFGPNHGFVLAPAPDLFEYQAIARRPNGGYILAGERNSRPWVVALRADGQLDRSFGNAGMVGIDYGYTATVRAVAIDPNGKILITGSTDGDFYVARFTADGRPDPSFGTNGKANRINFEVSTIGNARSKESGHDLFIQPDGKIVVVGQGGDCGFWSCNGKGLGLIRLQPDGRLDYVFGNNGKRLTTFSPGSAGGSSDGAANVVLRLRNGKILAVGWAKVDGDQQRLAIARYSADGDLDKSFHFDGKESYPGMGPGVAAVELPSGHVVVATSTGQVVAVQTDGKLATAFGNRGWTILSRFEAKQLHLQPDGKLLVLGAYKPVEAYAKQFTSVYRLTSNGQIDLSFGNGTGRVAHQPPSYEESSLITSRVLDTLVQPDGRMVFLLVDTWFQRETGKLLTFDFLLRLKANGEQDPAGSNPAPSTGGFAADDSYNTTQGQTRTIAAPGVLANDRAPNGGPLSASIVAQPLNGRATLLSNGSFSYTPNPGFVGTDRFTYQARDSQGNLATAIVQIKVNPPGGNSAPGASNIGYDLLQGTPLVIPAPGVLTNDRDPEGDELTVELTGLPEHGSVELSPDGGYVYTPDPEFVGTDFFYYRAGDGLDWSEPATVTLRVAAAGSNVPPIAVGDRYYVQRDGELSVEAPGLIENDQDHNGDAVTVEAVEGKGPSHGSLTLWPDGSFVYTPEPGFTGEDEFTYALSDGVNAKQTTVRIFVVEELAENPPGDDPELEVERPDPIWSVYLPLLQR